MLSRSDRSVLLVLAGIALASTMMNYLHTFCEGPHEALRAYHKLPYEKVDLNTASLKELMELEGIGPVLARRIIEYRDEHGGFNSIEELVYIMGIGPKLFEELKDEIMVKQSAGDHDP